MSKNPSSQQIESAVENFIGQGGIYEDVKSITNTLNINIEAIIDYKGIHYATEVARAAKELQEANEKLAKLIDDQLPFEELD